MEARYTCAVEDRSFRARHELMARYGGWECRIAEKEVMWWNGLAECPDDVLDLIYFFIAQYDDLERGFVELDRGWRRAVGASPVSSMQCQTLSRHEFEDTTS